MLGFTWVIGTVHFPCREVIAVLLFWPVSTLPALPFPSKISRHALWVFLTRYRKLESPGHREICLSFSEVSMRSKIGEMLSASLFSNLVWKNTSGKRNTSPFTVISDSQLPDQLSFLRRITSPYSVLLCWTGCSLSSTLNFFLIFLFILSHPLNYCRSTVIPLSFQLVFKFLSLAVFGILLPIQTRKRFLLYVTNLFLFTQNPQAESIPFFSLHPRSKVRPSVIFLCHYSGLLCFRLKFCTCLLPILLTFL